MQPGLNAKNVSGGASGSASARALLTVSRGGRGLSPTDSASPRGNRTPFPRSVTDRRLNFGEEPVPALPSSPKSTVAGRLWEVLKWFFVVILSLFSGRLTSVSGSSQENSQDFWDGLTEDRVRLVGRKASTSTIASEISELENSAGTRSIQSQPATPAKTPKVWLECLLECSLRKHQCNDLSSSQKQINALNLTTSKSAFAAPSRHESGAAESVRPAEWLKTRLQESLKQRLRVDFREDGSEMPSFDTETGRFGATFSREAEFSPNKVFLARHKLEDKLYIVRKLNFPRGFRGSAGQNKVREVLEALQRLSHPNLAKYITAWVEEETSPTPQNLPSIQDLAGLDLLSPATIGTPRSAPEIEETDLFRSSTFKLPSLPSPSEINAVIRPFDADINLEVEFGRPEAPSLVPSDASEAFPESSAGSLKLFVQYEYCQGLSVSSLLSQPGAALEDEEVFAIANEVLKAIRYLHSQDLALGKLAADNVFLGDDGSVKLCRPMTPDNADENGKDSFAGDFASLGLLLYELLGGFKTTHERVKMVRLAQQTRSLPMSAHRRLGPRAGLIESLLGYQTPPRSAAEVTALPSFRRWQKQVSNRLLEQQS